MDLKKLRQMAMEVAQKAYSPYSKLNIGCSILTTEGQIFAGCNVENSSYGATICAERNAISTAVSQGHTSFSAVYVYSPEGLLPCGICRQFLHEFTSPDLTIIIGDEQGNEKKLSMSDIFPRPFDLR